ncbi:hypothetical protein V2J09_020230 [Rumex salicifolius]
MSRVNGDRRNANSAVETLNAAANAIAMAEARAPPETSQKKRWSSCMSAYWCFRSQKHKKRIGRAILVPEPSSTVIEANPARNLILPTTMGAHFAAPPSSPASFIPSEPPSASQSPAGLLSFTSISADIHSPDGPRSIFAIGPYAHETQLVSPPTFSTYTTEPSTAPFTPPPESVHMTTPSSPEVPFAQFVDLSPNSSFSNMFLQSQYDHQGYQYYPGSPAGQLISPGSVISGSGTSSPLPDHELFTRGLYYRDLRFGVPPRLLNMQFWGSGRESGSLNPDGVVVHNQNTEDSLTDENDNQETGSQRVSFEMASEDAVRRTEKDEEEEGERSSVDDQSTNMTGRTSMEDATQKPQPPENAEEGQRCQRQRSASLGSIKEFNFDNVNSREPHKPCLGPNWWTNDTVTGKETEQPTKNWSFFPVAQSGAT